MGVERVLSSSNTNATRKMTARGVAGRNMAATSRARGQTSVALEELSSVWAVVVVVVVLVVFLHEYCMRGLLARHVLGMDRRLESGVKEESVKAARRLTVVAWLQPSGAQGEAGGRGWWWSGGVVAEVGI